ncbi:hypothetical protein BDK51DRAFT_47998 [Blyttiomyces helicus]|uniref:G-patch domain-containing protein n=1 Tax=Blyttiomyces helicus TaxID=388810 RepID=A0A4P9W3V1_9FUNG|nr:hypothetical protein BDK51DRAFT_47998 [Blyttiomyces helicus]|eukprot:RKO84826.1 hypothetical protein BDK51DRAFT_47998 [Blyttiomyces helicus]
MRTASLPARLSCDSLAEGSEERWWEGRLAAAHGLYDLCPYNQPRHIPTQRKPAKPPQPAVKIDPTGDYDPSRPNEYDLEKSQSRKRKLEKRLKREAEHKDRYRRKASRSPSPDGEPLTRTHPQSSPHKSATPFHSVHPSRVEEPSSGEDAYLRRAMLSNIKSEPPAASFASPPVPSDATTGAGENFAAKMMAKMGWKEGQCNSASFRSHVFYVLHPLVFSLISPLSISNREIRTQDYPATASAHRIPSPPAGGSPNACRPFAEHGRPRRRGWHIAGGNCG